MKVFVTGATGFVGREVIASFMVSGISVVAAVRKRSDILPAVVDQVLIGDLAELSSGLDHAFSDVDYVIHLAARVHIMNDDSSDPLAEFRKVNTEGTLNLARQAAKSGVKRFIYLSSIKVNGEGTESGKVFHLMMSLFQTILMGYRSTKRNKVCWL